MITRGVVTGRFWFWDDNFVMDVKQRYGRVFGLPANQIRFFPELNEAQVEEVRRYFSAGLVNVEKYVYAVKCDGMLVWRRERRDLLMESYD